ncbi:hypothetical protein OH77DRAFT_1426200 [Trametes cingulata]|nr:hypothetical protein OH77DRAFT_1426200 [Trametes cingulata]
MSDDCLEDTLSSSGSSSPSVPTHPLSTPPSPHEPTFNGGWSQGDTPPSFRASLSLPEGSSPSHASNIDGLATWTPELERQLHTTLDGPQFSCGLPSSRSPLLARFAPEFDPWHFESVINNASTSDEAAIRAFCHACIEAAERERPAATQPTAAEKEHHGLFGLLALCTLTLAKALAQRDIGGRRRWTADLRLLLDAMDSLVALEEDVIQQILTDARMY